MLKRQRNGSQKYSGFLWLHMIPKFLYLEELIALRQVMYIQVIKLLYQKTTHIKKKINLAKKSFRANIHDKKF
jgi:hypothetical protein